MTSNAGSTLPRHSTCRCRSSSLPPLIIQQTRRRHSGPHGPGDLRLRRGPANNLNQVVHSGRIAKSFEVATAKPPVRGKFYRCCRGSTADWVALCDRRVHGGIVPNGGEGGIRTPGTLASTPHFECGAFNHSATSPKTTRDSRSRTAHASARPCGRQGGDVARRVSKGK